MLDNVIYLAIIVHQTWLKAQEQRDIRALLDALKRQQSRHLADLRAANCDRYDELTH